MNEKKLNEKSKKLFRTVDLNYFLSHDFVHFDRSVGYKVDNRRRTMDDQLYFQSLVLA